MMVVMIKLLFTLLNDENLKYVDKFLFSKPSLKDHFS